MLFFRNITILLAFLVAFESYGQEADTRLWDLSFHQGKIWKHTPKITYTIPASSWGAQLNIQNQTNGSKEWQVAQGFPLLGLSLAYYDLGDPEVLGKAIGVIPNFSLRLLDKPSLKSQFLIGTGLAWLTRAYHVVDNSINNAIGSNLNNVTFFRLSLGYLLNKHWELRAGASFIHFSNAATQLPNLGINLPTWTIGCRYAPKAPPNLRKSDFSYEKKPTRRIGVNVLYGMAFRERSVPGGPKQPVYLAVVAGEYRFSKYNHFHFGLEYEFHKEIVQFGLHNFTFRDAEEARKAATRWGLMIADELIFGQMSIYLQTGIYISKASFMKPRAIYNKLSLRYFFPPAFGSDFKLYAAIFLKSHAITAEYAALGLGVKW